MFLRDPKGTPVGCTAITVNESTGFAFYRMSVLNPADRFNRKLARELATGRLVEGGIPVRIPKNANMHDISRAIMTDIINAPGSPTRAIRSAKHWLRHNDPKIHIAN
jgi:hypothetical protein